MNVRAPLAGRRIVVTRAADQAGALVDLVGQRGGEPVVVPLVAVVPVASGLAELRRLAPDDFDWLVVTSPNGVDAYVSVHDRAPAHVAAVGTTTAEALRARRVEVDLVPAEQRASALAHALIATVPAATALVVQSAEAAPDLVDALRGAGWSVTAVATHRPVPVQPTGVMRRDALGADAVLFASGSAARAWAAAFGTETPPVVVAMGPSTAEAARAVGIEVTSVADDSSLAGMLDTLERVLGDR
ncbi:MAG: uroporphyrinogen-III synthase [Ilumatobacteraceae bacterium]